MKDLLPVKTALISVSDKQGVAEFAGRLAKMGVRLISTGGTFKTLRDAGLAVEEVSAVTNFPEIMDGRVKTLHPAIHGGILARRDEGEHLAAMKAHGIPEIDMVVVSLYPFEETLASGEGYQDCIENIDIGGPAMIRAAAKNHEFVCVVTDKGDYEAVLAAMTENGGAVPLALRRKLAARAFARTSSYDALISQWLLRETDESFPRRFVLAGSLLQELRYGENPHQDAAFYTDGSDAPGVATAKQLQGKELSYNNINDTDAAFELVSEFESPAVAIIKHANPCGVAQHGDLFTAYEAALACDPTSAFGGVVALNRPVNAALARKITEIFTEIVIAPEVDKEAQKIFAARKNLRVLITEKMPDPARGGLMIKAVSGGFLLQNRDNGRVAPQDLKVVTKRAPTADELRDMLFAFRVCKHVKSNAIVYARDGATKGIGAGQMSRVDSARIAAWKGGESVRGSVVASDAFFPFADGLVSAAEAGVTAVIQPGGSVRDDEVIAAADERGLAMVMTGMRHFRH